MKLVMTMMVRDEADIIRPVIEHHLANGFDRIIVTDNGSIDGTFEILESFGDEIDLRQDPVQRKQQHSVVTAMARDAFSTYAADWVVNADADEFWMPLGGASTLREAFSQISTSVGTFIVPVVDMTGAPAIRGTGFERLVYRDTRSTEQLNDIGLFAHSTPDSVHVGRADIEVSQGNHAVNLESSGDGSADGRFEVLHFPWRSWEQFERKVVSAGRAYASNPDLLPSPNHHGMREFKRSSQGTLQAFYILRHPTTEDFDRGTGDGTLVLDTRIADRHASPVPDTFFDERTLTTARSVGPVFVAFERKEREALARQHQREAELLGYVEEGRQRIDQLLAELDMVSRREEDLRKAFEATPSQRARRAAASARRRIVRGPAV